MDLRTALRMMTSPVTMPGQSNAALVQKVLNKQLLSTAPPTPIPKTPTTAVGLDAKGTVVRPIDALHRLSRVTALTIEDDVYATYQHWGWIRYLGAFSHRGRPAQLSLDPEALRHVHANQRRVMSEDLGVGFGVLLAEHWCRSMGATGPIRTVDVDKALRDDRKFRGLVQAPNAKRQPDYLLQYASPAVPAAQESRLLETKGTVDKRNAIDQLAHAMTQLASLLLDGRALQGVAISTVSTPTGISYLAVDPEEDSEPWKPDENTLDQAKRQAPQFAEEDGVIDVSRSQFLSSAAVTANATLADFAGLSEVVEAWLPDDKVLRSRGQRSRREVSVGEIDFAGVEFSITAPGNEGTLRIFQGVERAVEEALRTGRDERVRESQEQFSRSIGLDHLTGEDGLSSEAEATSVSGEGAVLHITVTD